VHAVINHLRVSVPPAAETVRDLQQNALKAAMAVDGIIGVHLVKVADDHLVMLIFGEHPQALQRLSAEVGSPWIERNIGPLLTRPPDRMVGEVLASTLMS
jgi:hypothetical protein